MSAEIGPARLSALLNGPYGGTVRSDPVSLGNGLPFYTPIRQGYVWLMETAHKAGVDYARSSYLIAAFFQAVSVLLLGLIAASVGVSLWVIPGGIPRQLWRNRPAVDARCDGLRLHPGGDPAGAATQPVGLPVCRGAAAGA